MNEFHVRRPDLNLLVIFDAVCRHGQVTAAAEALNLSQSAVSHALNRLRDRVGDPLFIRTRSGLLLTPKAQDMLPLTARIIELSAQAFDSQAFDPLTTTRRFCIGVSEYAMLTIIPEITRSLRRDAPASRLELSGVGADTLSNLATGELDCAFWGAAIPSAPYRHLPLYREHFTSFMSEDHPLAEKTRGGELTLSDYLACPHVIVRLQNTGDSPLDIELHKQGHRRNIMLGVPSFTSGLASLRGTDLIFSVPSRLAGVLRGNDLICFRLPVAIADFSYSLVWHERLSADPAFLWLRRKITDITGGPETAS